MTITPSIDDFVSDMFVVAAPGGYNVVMYMLDEKFQYLGRTVENSTIGMSAVLRNGEESIPLPRVIGMGNDLVKIIAIDKTLEGKVISRSNIGGWSVEIDG